MKNFFIFFLHFKQEKLMYKIYLMHFLLFMAATETVLKNINYENEFLQCGTKKPVSLISMDFSHTSSSVYQNIYTEHM